MTAYTNPLDPTAPLGTELVKLGAADIRELKAALIERLLTLVSDVNANPLVLLASVQSAQPLLVLGAAVNCAWAGAARPYYPLNSMGVTNGNIVTVDVIKYLPFYVGRDCTVDELGFAVVTGFAAGAKARVGLYNSSATTYGPTTRIIDAGEQDITTTGYKMLTGQAIALKKGVLYWTAFLTSSVTTGTAVTINLTDIYAAITGVSGATPGSVHTVLAEAQAYGALPANAGPTAYATSNNGVAVLARFSA